MKKITQGLVALMTLGATTFSFAQLTLSSPTVVEGDSGTTNAVITATLAAPAPIGGTTIIYSLEDVTTNASDFDHTAGNAVIPEGQSSVDITIGINSDTDVEGNETFKLNAKLDVFIDGTFSTGNTSSFNVLPGVSPCNVAPLTGQNYLFEIGNQNTYDGGSGSVNKIIEVDCQSQGFQVLNTVMGAEYIVTFDASRRITAGTPSPLDTKVAAIDGNSSAGSEIASATATRSNTTFAFTQESFNFTAASTETTIAFTTSNLGGLGMIFDNLSVVRTGSFDAVSTVTISNDDFVTLSLSSPTITEGNSGTSLATVTATISQPAPLGGTTIIYQLDDVTTDASDFDHTAGNAVIPQGQTSVDITIPINGDTDVESDETFNVNAKLDIFVDGTFTTGNASSFEVLPGINACSAAPQAGQIYVFEIGNQGTYDGGSSSTNKIIEVDCQSQGFQVLNTVMGAEYIVTFEASRRITAGTPVPVDTKVAAIDGNLSTGSEIASATATRSNTSFALTQESFNFTAASSQTTIAFTSMSTTGLGMIFDNLSVVRTGSFDATSVVTITNDDAVLGVNDFTLSNVSIYPNPATSNILIKGLKSVDEIIIYDILGSRILTSTELEVNINALSKGVYFMKIKNDGSEVVKKFIKK